MARITLTDQEVDELIMSRVGELEPFFDLQYPVDVRLGNGTLTVEELLRLKEGDRVALDRPSDGYVQVVVGETPFAEAEVVVRKGKPTARLIRIC